MTDKKIIIRTEIKNPGNKKEVEEILAQTEGCVLQASDQEGPCDLLIIDIGEDLQKDFMIIHSKLNSGEAGDVFVTSSRTEPEVLIQALRSGVKEFLPQPLNPEEVRTALNKYRDKKFNITLSRGRGKIIDLVGTKGGVGTTTIAVNLATSLHALKGNPSVVLVDMNPLLGEIPLFLDIKASFDWGELVKNINRVDSTFLMTILAKHPSGVFVLPAATALDGVLATGEVIEKLLSLMLMAFDYVVIDSGKHLNNASLKVLKSADLVLMVSILDLGSMTNTRRLLKTFQNIGFPRKEKTEIIINRFQKRTMITLDEATKTLNKKIFCLLPNDYQTSVSAINQGKPISILEPKSDLARNFVRLASMIADRN
jgi:pilus assembly protein CpaE